MTIISGMLSGDMILHHPRTDADFHLRRREKGQIGGGSSELVLSTQSDRYNSGDEKD